MWKSFFMARSICSTGHVKQDINPARFRCIFSRLCRVWNKGIATNYIDICSFFPSWIQRFRGCFLEQVETQMLLFILLGSGSEWPGETSDGNFSSYLIEVISYDDSDLLFKPASQTLHLNGFFPSWTDSICSFKFTFWAKLLLKLFHLNGFFQSWTVSICTFKVLYMSLCWFTVTEEINFEFWSVVPKHYAIYERPKIPYACLLR